jgi:small subunit ribosomal protein S21
VIAKLKPHAVRLGPSQAAAEVLETARVGRIGRPMVLECVDFGKDGHSNVLVTVRDNNVDQALRALKKKMQREGVYREMKMRRSYEKPSEKRARERAEAVRRYRKLMRKRMEREGY